MNSYGRMYSKYSERTWLREESRDQTSAAPDLQGAEAKPKRVVSGEATLTGARERLTR